MLSNAVVQEEIKYRRRRFSRDNPSFHPQSKKSRAGKFAMTPRDLDMLVAIAQNRMLSTPQVCRLFGGDAQHVASRLRELYHRQYLDRPRSQLLLRDDGIGHGSSAMVYCITSVGLAQLDETRRSNLLGYGKLSWVKKGSKSKREFIEHTLAIADVSIGLDRALRVHPHLTRSTQLQLQSGMSKTRRASAWPFRMTVDYEDRKVSVVPDLVFAVGDRVARKTASFMLELDRGFMAVHRSDFRQNSILRKLLIYGRAFEGKQHRSLFDWRGMRVVILTTSDARIATFVAAARKWLSSSVARIFLFGTHEASQDMLGYNFTDGRGKKLKLID